MPNKKSGESSESSIRSLQHDSVGAWAKRCYFAGRTLMDTILRPYKLGSAQWYVLHHLATAGPTMQRDLVRLLQVERATLSGIVETLVKKALIAQVPDCVDQRQKLLRLTPAGKKYWKRLPDLAMPILSIAFEGLDENDLTITRKVLQTATERLNNYMSEREKK